MQQEIVIIISIQTITKDMTINGKKKKISEISDKISRKLDFSASEQALYNRVCKIYSGEFNDIVSHGGDKAIVKNCRQVCAHPCLVKDELERKEKESILNTRNDALDSYANYERNSSNNGTTSDDGFDLDYLDDDDDTRGKCWKCGSMSVACLTKCGHVYCEEYFIVELESANKKSFGCDICGTVLSKKDTIAKQHVCDNVDGKNENTNDNKNGSGNNDNGNGDCNNNIDVKKAKKVKKNVQINFVRCTNEVDIIEPSSKIREIINDAGRFEYETICTNMF